MFEFNTSLYWGRGGELNVKAILFIYAFVQQLCNNKNWNKLFIYFFLIVKSKTFQLVTKTCSFFFLEFVLVYSLCTK